VNFGRLLAKVKLGHSRLGKGKENTQPKKKKKNCPQKKIALPNYLFLYQSVFGLGVSYLWYLIFSLLSFLLSLV
jgi:hypothetical protein